MNRRGFLRGLARVTGVAYLPEVRGPSLRAPVAVDPVLLRFMDSNARQIMEYEETFGDERHWHSWTLARSIRLLYAKMLGIDDPTE